MKQLRSLFPKVLIFLPLYLLACSDNNSDFNLSGMWRAGITFSSCSPTDVCTAAGFQTGTTVSAVMNLNQNGNDITGTYTYEGAGINANIAGSAGSDQVLLDGSATNLFGTITVRVQGTVSNNNTTIQSNVTHQISLIDGREGTVIGAGTFTKQ